MVNSYKYEQKLLGKIDFQQHKPLSDILYEALKEAILKGVYPLGERINENGLSEQLAISRTPIRKALTRLIDEGLLEYIYGYGTVVKSVNLNKIKEIFKIRKALEVTLYEEVMAKLTEEDLAFLDRSCQKMDQICQQDEIQQLLQEFSQYNQKMNQIAQMDILLSLQEELNTYFKNFRDYSLTTRSRRILAVKEHRIIVNCLAGGDREALKKAVIQHISHSEKAAIDIFVNREIITPEDYQNFNQLYQLFECQQADCPIREE